MVEYSLKVIRGRLAKQFNLCVDDLCKNPEKGNEAKADITKARHLGVFFSYRAGHDNKNIALAFGYTKNSVGHMIYKFQDAFSDKTGIYHDIVDVVDELKFRDLINS